MEALSCRELCSSGDGMTRHNQVECAFNGEGGRGGEEKVSGTRILATVLTVPTRIGYERERKSW